MQDSSKKSVGKDLEALSVQFKMNRMCIDAETLGKILSIFMSVTSEALLQGVRERRSFRL